MPNAFVLLTALPPTTGHLELVKFADKLVSRCGTTTVLLNTQPREPFPFERAKVLESTIFKERLHGVHLHHMHRTIEQDPSTPGFWDMWKMIMVTAGMRPGDYIVASEAYGKRLAEETGGHFFPYDMDRVINPAKATAIRDHPLSRFSEILPEFQPHLRTTVTIFGAESCGKTTLSMALADALDGRWLFEYARPFLENTSTDINVESMTNIWRGQLALQQHGATLSGKPLIVRDTDLFSTVGYWNLPGWREELGGAPEALVADALAHASDLYIVTPSNIPFEEDPLRYGGNVREGDDEYWIDLLDEYDLPYFVLEPSDRRGRLADAWQVTGAAMKRKVDMIAYDRKGF